MESDERCSAFIDTDMYQTDAGGKGNHKLPKQDSDKHRGSTGSGKVPAVNCDFSPCPRDKFCLSDVSEVDIYASSDTLTKVPESSGVPWHPMDTSAV